MSAHYRIKYNDKEYEVEVARQGEKIVVSHEGEEYDVYPQLTPSSAAAPEAAPLAARAPAAAPVAVTPPAPTASAGGNQVVAPMAGTVKEIVVEQGAQVGAGDRVIIMEAMKMDMDVCAPCAGKIGKIEATVGASVGAGDLLITLT